MTAPRTDPPSTVPVEPLSAHAAAQEFWRGKCIDCAHPEHEMTCGETVPNGDPSNGPAYCPCAAQMEWMEAEIIRLRAAARASQPITATARDLVRDVIDALSRERGGPDDSGAEDYDIEAFRVRLAALPVREDEPTGIDVEALARALAKEYGARIVGAAERVAAEYDRLNREASHVR